jgi:hypothetical protein
MNNNLAHEQYPFLTKLSTYDLINNILSVLSNKLVLEGLFCDLTKAFDCVNHEVLVAKLGFYAVNRVARKLIKSYLADRYQRTLINNNSSGGVSEWQKVKQAVRHGSILWPLIFLVYINDFLFTINESLKPIFFADDTSMLCSHSNSYDIIITLK